MGTPLGPKYVPYTYMDPWESASISRGENCAENGEESAVAGDQPEAVTEAPF